MKDIWTTEEVYMAENVKKTIAVRWAKANGVQKHGRDYVWTIEDVKSFVKRNKKVGRPKV